MFYLLSHIIRMRIPPRRLVWAMEREAAAGRRWGGRKRCLGRAESRGCSFLALHQEPSAVNLNVKEMRLSACSMHSWKYLCSNGTKKRTVFFGLGTWIRGRCRVGGWEPDDLGSRFTRVLWYSGILGLPRNDWVSEGLDTRNRGSGRGLSR